MSDMIRSWVQNHWYNQTVRHLRALSPGQLRALGIGPAQIEHLASEISLAVLRP